MPGVTFKNNAKVRNVFLGTGTPVNYTAPTKVANGKTPVRSSRVEQEYAVNPRAFQWRSNHSYNNTYSRPQGSEKAAQDRHAATAMRTYGNSWPNAFAVIEQNQHNAAEREVAYLVKIRGLVTEKFGPLHELEIMEFLEGLEAMNDLTKKLLDRKITKAEYDEQAETVLADWHLNTEMSIDDLISNYEAFKEVYMEKTRADAEGVAAKKKALNNIQQRTRRNKNAARRWQTAPKAGENRSAGAELLSLAAKHSRRPANFAEIFNGVLKP